MALMPVGITAKTQTLDLLVLVDKEEITRNDQIHITHPLDDIEFDTGVVISPMVVSRNKWKNHRVTPFYENVVREGKML